MASLRAIRSFVVRAFRDRGEDADETEWRGHVRDVETGERSTWTEPSAIGAIVESHLASSLDEPSERAPGFDNPPATALLASESMTAPTMNVVLADLLGELGTRLPGATPPLPDPNVTFDRVGERLVGLGGIRGVEDASRTGPQVLKGGRLDATVRFQLWANTATDVDTAVTTLQGTILDDKEQLRNAGFLKLKAAATTVAEHVPTENSWRKTASFDVLYEYQYRDSDDAQALIARIPVATDLNEAHSAERETATITDEMARWDNEGAAPLTVRGRASVGTVDVLAFVPGPPPSGQITLVRTSDDAAGPPVAQPDLPTFLAAVTGEQPSETNAAVTMTVAGFLAALVPSGLPIELGDWDTDLSLDSYDGLALTVTPGVQLPRARDTLQIHYSDPGGLDTDAVLYIRVNAP